MSTALRDQIVAEARTWVGTPYQDQSSLKGVACDCIGLVLGDLQQLGVIAPDWWQRDGAAYAGYAPAGQRGPITEALRTYLREIPVAEAQAGDIVHMSFGDSLQHLAILVPYRHGGLAIVHALSTVGRVVEHRLDAFWRRAIQGAYAAPEAC